MFVVVSEDVCLEETMRECFIRGAVVAPRVDLVERGCFVFHPSHDLMSREVVGAHALVTVEDECIPVKVVKCASGRVVLKKGTRVGVLQRLNSGDGFYENVRLMGEESGGETVQNPLEHVNIGSLPRDVKDKLMQVLREYEDIFSKNKMDIGRTHLVQHRIDVGDSMPIATAPRRIPMALEEKVDKMVDDLLKNDVIQPSESPWNAPIVVVAKKNGDIRLCVDYRRLNAVTRRPIFPIPATQQLLDCLQDSAYFSTLDLSQGYHQIPMAPEDMEKTAFATRKGHFEYKRMPFGLSTAPATFQRLMHIVFKHENWEMCLVYLDDVIIFGRSVEEHLERLRAVLQRVREAELKLSPSKCSFMKTEVEYLGHVVSASGIKTDPRKVDKVQQWPTPRTVKQLRSFLGFCGYYRRFVRDYANLVQPLEALCGEKPTDNRVHRNADDISDLWNSTHEECFQKLKQALTSAPVLAYPSDKGRFILDTDACDTGIGAVLSQLQNGEERVIAYASRKLTKSERRYCVTKKELLAIVTFVRHFRHYLFGRCFTVRTDHKALMWLLNWKKPNTSQYCLWKAELEMYDIEVVHRAGNLHTNADALSRLPACHQCELKHENPVTRRHVKLIADSSASCVPSDDRATSMKLVMNLVTHDVAHAAWTYDDDADICRVMELMRQGQLSQTSVPPEVRQGSPRLQEFWRQRHSLRIRGDSLYFVQGDKYKLVVPHKEKHALIDATHKTLCHAGSAKVTFVLKDTYYWPNMDEDVLQRLKTCEHCLFVKGSPAHNRAPLQTTMVSAPFERIALDISGPFQPSRHGHRYILAVIDYFSKFPVLIPLRHVDAETVARKVCHQWIALFGAPQVIHSDRGTNFESQVFKEQCALFGVKKTRTCPYYPQADGLVERLFRTIKPLISATVRDRGIAWCEALPLVEMALRSTVQASTGYSPFEVLFGRRMRLPLVWQLPSQPVASIQNEGQYVGDLRETLKILQSRVSNNIQQAAQRQADWYDQNGRATPFQVGDMVLVKVEGHAPATFPRMKFVGPFEVVRTVAQWTYELQDCRTGHRCERNYNQLKTFLGHQRKPHTQVMSESSDTTDPRDHVPTVVPPELPAPPPNPPTLPAPAATAGDAAASNRRYPARNHAPPQRLGARLV